MKDSIDLIGWAVSIGVAWIILSSLTGIDVWLKKLVGQKDKTSALAARVDALEKRLADLEKK
jgi:hypothetical protein